MKVETVALEGGYRLLRVQVPWEEVAPDYDDILRDFARRPLSGFRPGKAPRALLEQRWRREIAEQLQQRGAQRWGPLALQEAQAEATGPVEASEIQWEKGQSFRFTVRFFPVPEFELPDYRAIALPETAADPQGELSHHLLAVTSLALPEELVRRELAFDGQAKADPESDIWQAAARRVKLMLILKRIAREEGIEVEDADVELRIAEKAAEFGTGPEALRAELEQGGGRARLKDLLLAESVLEYLLESLTGKAK